MRWLRWLFALGGLAAGAVLIALLPERTLFTHAEAHTALAATPGERWACPMMDFIGNRPGDCPVCGMKMTKVTAGELSREQQRRMDIQTVRVAEGPARATIRAYGAVRYDDRTLQVVIPRVAGRIIKRHSAALHPGNTVKAGDPVVDLYSPDAFASQAELAAAILLGDQPTIQALTQRLQRWNLSGVAQAIRNGQPPTDTITVTSPFSGRVILALEGEAEAMSARLPQVGQDVMADSPLLRLVDPQAFMLVIHVPEARAHWLREGQRAVIASDDRGELPDVVATLTWVAPELNLEIRAREVHVHLRDPKKRLLPGSLINARIDAALGPNLNVADASEAGAIGRFLLIPKSAVLSTGVRHVAWRVANRQEDGRLRFELAPLALGPRLEDAAGNDVYIVRAGLRAGDEVATQGLFLIDSQAQLAGTASLLFPTGAVAPAAAHPH